MIAGREMDARIAAKVMGWTDVGRESNRYHTEYVDHGVPPDTTLRERVPHFSTDITAAWLVLEKVSGFVSKRAEPWWSVAVFHGQKGQIGCRVYSCAPGFSIFDASRVVIAEEVADTAPLAICRAALAALAIPSPT